MSSPPARPAPAPPSAGIEDAVAQLRAALERDPSGAGADEVTRGILDKLNAEMAKLYADGEDGQDAEDEDGEYDEEEDEDDDGEEYSEDAEEYKDGDAGGDDRDSTGRYAGSASKPRPYDLWRAAHEVERGGKEVREATTAIEYAGLAGRCTGLASRVQKLVLTKGEWDGLVSRLNDSSKRRQMYLLRAQHKQIADELSGLTFVPHISEKSRELAAHNKSLPERVAALMRKKKAKLDKIRHEQVEKELAEATFKPKLNKPKLSKVAEMQDHMKRHVKHLMEYEKHRRTRADQRRQLVQELEDRELTFTPAINSNSVRIVGRLNREREEQARLAALGMADASATSPGPLTTSRAAKRALANALAAGADPRALKMLGRSFLPGHEEETFHPRINPRSQALYRPGVDDKNVYNRLYESSTAARAAKVETARSPAAPVRASSSLADSGSVGSREREVHSRDTQGYPLDSSGEPAPGHPHYFNVVAFEPGRMDFILRRIFPPSALSAAAASAAAGAVPFVMGGQ